MISGRSVRHQIRKSENALYAKIYKANGLTSAWPHVYMMYRSIGDRMMFIRPIRTQCREDLTC